MPADPARDEVVALLALGIVRVAVDVLLPAPSGTLLAEPQSYDRGAPDPHRHPRGAHR